MLTTAIRSFIRGRGPMLAYLFLSLIAFLVPPTAAILVNVTVDDTFGSSDGTVIPAYSPNNASWHLGSPTEQCSVCALKPSEFDMGQIYDQSWHHATYFFGIPIQVSVTFRGTAVYVYNVIPNYLRGANTFVNLSFSIDGQTVGSFTHTPDSSSTILYNHLVYSNTDLSDSVHTFVMSASGSKESLIFFDYLVYTTNVDVAAAATTPGAASSSASPNPQANSNTPALIASTSSPSASTASSSSSNTNSASSSSSSSSSSAFPSSNIPSTGSNSPSTTTLIASPSSSAAAMVAAPSTHTNTAATAGGVTGGVIIILVALILFFLIFCRQRRRRAALSTIDPYSFTSPDSGVPPLMGGLSVRPVTRSMYSNLATASSTGPSLGSPTVTVTSPASSGSSARTFETKRELELKRRMETLLQQREMAAARHHHHRHHHGRLDRHRGLSTFSDSNSSTVAAESRVSVGAVQALQEEIAALRGVLSGMAAFGVHTQPAICESEILPEYEETRWSATGNVGSGFSGRLPW